MEPGSVPILTVPVGGNIPEEKDRYRAKEFETWNGLYRGETAVRGLR